MSLDWSKITRMQRDKLPLLTTIVITILVLIPGLNCKLPYKPNERNCLQVLDHIFFWTITNQSTRITTHIAYGTQGFGGIGFTNQQKTYILVAFENTTVTEYLLNGTQCIKFSSLKE